MHKTELLLMRLGQMRPRECYIVHFLLFCLHREEYFDLWARVLRINIIYSILKVFIGKLLVNERSTLQGLSRALHISDVLLAIEHFNMGFWACVEALRCLVLILKIWILELQLRFHWIGDRKERLVVHILHSAYLGIRHQLFLVEPGRHRVFILYHIFHIMNSLNHSIVRISNRFGVKNVRTNVIMLSVVVLCVRLFNLIVLFV